MIICLICCISSNVRFKVLCGTSQEEGSFMEINCVVQVPRNEWICCLSSVTLLRETQDRDFLNCAEDKPLITQPIAAKYVEVNRGKTLFQGTQIGHSQKLDL